MDAITAFKNLGLGEKIVMSSSAVAVASLMLNWVELGIMTQSGFGQQGYFFLVFFIYPLYAVIKELELNRVVGLVCGALAVVASIWYISSKTVELFGRSVNAAGTGAYVFMLAAIALTVGVFIATKKKDTAEDTPKVDATETV